MLLSYLLFEKVMGKPGISLYHLNLLHLQMDIARFSFEFFLRKMEKIRSFSNTNSC